MALALAGALRSSTGVGLALGSPIDSPAPTSRAAHARSDVEPSSVGASSGPSPDTPEGSAAEVAPELLASPAPPVHRPDPEPRSEPRPPAELTVEPAWLRAPLPDAFVTARPVGRRRWLFGRRRDYVVTAAPDPSWPAGPSGGLRAVPPPPPPGFDWSGALPAIPDRPSPPPSAVIDDPGTQPAGPPPLQPESAGRPQDR